MNSAQTRKTDTSLQQFGIRNKLIIIKGNTHFTTEVLNSYQHLNRIDNNCLSKISQLNIHTYSITSNRIKKIELKTVNGYEIKPEHRKVTSLSFQSFLLQIQ